MCLLAASIMGVPSSALAADMGIVEVTGSTIVVQGTSGGETLRVVFLDRNTISVGASVALEVGPGCELSEWGDAVECPTAGITHVVSRGLAGDDLLTTRAETEFFLPVHYFGGDGADDLRGGPGDDVLDGEAGNEKQILGNIGNDVIRGGPGNDDYLTGDEPTQFPGVNGADDIDGGPGTDRLVEDRSTDGLQIWILDGKPNDGLDRDGDVRNGAEEGDNIRPTVENILGGDDADLMVGTSGPNHFDGDDGADYLLGMGGSDRLETLSSDAVVDGGEGDDYVSALGQTYGGAGSDEVYFSGFADAGPGIDSLQGSYTNDVVVSTDGEIDQVSCGRGADILYADGLDVVAADPTNACELLVGEVSSGTYTKKAVQLSVSQAGQGDVRVTILQRGKPLGSTTVKPSGAGLVTVSIPLKAAASKRLASSARVDVVTAVSAGGATPLQASRSVTLSR